MQPNITTLFMLSYAIAAPNLQNYGSQGRRGLYGENQLKPLNISPELEDIAKLIYLLDFDTSYAGEIGVLSFAATQNYGKSLQIGLWLARLLYPILAPQQTKAIFVNLAKG
ncbi:hypothetical protein H6G91_22280 [Nostoc muscorum FACHB-395]|nr:hypothetical protein [Desmonostoc muscorum FACHB-395]